MHRGNACRWLAIGCLLAAVASVGGLAGDTPARRTPPSNMDDEQLNQLLRLHHTETEQVRLVLLPTSVTDKKGRIVRGLDRTDFHVFENQVLQEIKFFAAEASEPISLAFLLDVSGSMRQVGKLNHAKEAIRFFVDQLHVEDQFGLICFADEQVDWVTDFTRNRERFLQRLSVQRGWGQTALHDAVAAAPSLVDEKIQGRRALILITDGVDNLSQLTVEQALDIAAHVNVPIYTIGFLSVPESHLPKGTVETNLEILTRVSSETGGKLYAVYGVTELKEAITDLNNELRYQYLIGYYPSRGSLDGAYREIELRTSKNRHRVRTRSGYYAE
jgi:VWFA-related protein